ncbi:MAG: ATP-grasp domain-containing protein [Calditrichia bacterium]
MLKNDAITVLVTGVGAPPGVSIFKAFRQARLNLRLIATDADPLSVGLFRADVAYRLPRISENEQEYIGRLKEICAAENVRLAAFGSEIEMRKMAPRRDKFEAESGTKLILNSAQHIELFMDKWNMVQALNAKALPAPDSVLARPSPELENFLAQHPFPVILKPRLGSGSKNFYILKNREELNFFSAYIPDAIIQEYLLPDNEEYTVGIYKSPCNGYVGQIVFKRDLAAGLTYKAEVVFDAEIEAVCRKLVESFDIWGPINIQLRKTSAGIKIFEVNLRFSSSAVMRACFGFNEAELCVQDLFLQQTIPPFNIRKGYALRYWDEIYIDENALQCLRESGTIVKPRSTRIDDF